MKEQSIKQKMRAGALVCLCHLCVPLTIIPDGSSLAAVTPGERADGEEEEEARNPSRSASLPKTTVKERPAFGPAQNPPSPSPPPSSTLGTASLMRGSSAMASEAEADAAPGGKVTVAAREEASKMRLRSLCATRPQLRIMLRPCTAIAEDEQDLVLMPSAAAPSVLWASVEFDLREDERSVTTRGISILDASALGKSISVTRFFS